MYKVQNNFELLILYVVMASIPREHGSEDTSDDECGVENHGVG